MNVLENVLGQRFYVSGYPENDDNCWVELLDIMPNPTSEIPESPDSAVVQAARVSFNGDSKGDEADKKLLLYLYRNQHMTPFEQVQFKFRVRMPLIVERQWVRYRSWHFNAESRRYTEVEDDEFYVPTEWRLQSASNKQASEGALNPHDAEFLQYTLAQIIRNGAAAYYNALNMGVAREQARLFLPAFGLYSTWIMTVDARNLIHFLQERMDEHAQHEIRMYANCIYENIFKAAMPWTVEAMERYQFKLVDNDAP